MYRRNLLILLSLGFPGLLLFKGGQMGKFNPESKELSEGIKIPSNLIYGDAKYTYLLSLITLTGHLMNGTNSNGSHVYDSTDSGSVYKAMTVASEALNKFINQNN